MEQNLMFSNSFPSSMKSKRPGAHSDDSSDDNQHNQDDILSKLNSMLQSQYEFSFAEDASNSDEELNNDESGKQCGKILIALTQASTFVN
jgi:hypothetical protein